MIGIGFTTLIPLMFILPFLPIDLMVNALLLYFTLMLSQFDPYLLSSLEEIVASLLMHLSRAM